MAEYTPRDFEDRPKRFETDQYQLTGNNFGYVLNTWRNFADKGNRANMD